MAHTSFSKIKEVVSSWNNVRQLLRSGDQGHLVPVVIPKERRSFRWLMWFVLAFYTAATSMILFAYVPALAVLGILVTLGLLGMGGLGWWTTNVIEIEQGTTGVVSRFGKIVKTLNPGRNYLYWPWEVVEFVVDTSTEIPYTAPVLSSPTQENVPLKSIEFFLKFRIIDPVRFVRNIGASNFDVVLSSAVQDAIRRRSRIVETSRAYDLRGSDVADMQEYLNRQMQRYGVRITGANIPDVQLPDQYSQNLATREQVAKERVAYEKEWELIRKRKTDNLLLEIERSKKIHAEKLIMVKEAVNRAREDVAQMLQERETEADKIRLEIEAHGRAELASAENEARALNRLGKSYRDNQAVLKYELAMRRLRVAEALMQQSPRPVLVNGQPEGNSAIGTLIMAQVLPKLMQPPPSPGDGNAQQQQQGNAIQGFGNQLANAASALLGD